MNRELEIVEQLILGQDPLHRGQALHTQTFAGGKPDTPACTSCHGATPRSSGRTPADVKLKRLQTLQAQIETQASAISAATG